MKKEMIPKLLGYYFTPAFKNEMSRALNEFFGYSVEEARFLEIDCEETIELFNEWLVYNFEIKNGKTLLEDFCARNPLNLPEGELRNYQELLENKYGTYEILQVKWHKGLKLRNIQTGEEYWIQEKSQTEQAQKGQIIFARIGKVGNHWELTGADSMVLPVKVSSRAKEFFSEIRDVLTPKDTYEIFYKNDEEERQWEIQTKDPAKALDDFQRALEKVRLDSFISAQTVKKWIENSTQKEDGRCCINLIFGLLEEEDKYEREDIEEMVEAFSAFYNTIPQKSLGNKSPNECWAKQKKEDADWSCEITPIGTGDWLKHQKKASEYFKKNNPKKALEYYNKCFQSLLSEKITSREIYRLFANTALAHFELGNREEGAALLEIALELNPNYDFGQATIKRYKEGEFDNMIMRGIILRTEERMKDPNFSMNKWDFDKIKKKWPAEKILSGLKEYGIETDEKTFRKEAAKYSSIGDFSDAFLFPSYKGKEEDMDFVSIAAYGLWKRWCSDIPSIESLSEDIDNFWNAVLDEEDSDNKKNTEKELGHLEKMAEKISPEFLQRWKKNMEYQSDVPDLSMSLGRLVGTKFEERSLALAKKLRKKTGGDYFLLPDACSAIYHGTDWEEKLEKLNELIPYEYAFYLEAAALFCRLGNVQSREECLKKALVVVEKRDQDRVYDLKNSASTIYEDYKEVLRRMEIFYKEQKNKTGIDYVRKIKKETKKREEKLSQSPESEKLEQRAQEIMNELFQKRFSRDPANRYFQFLKETEINFAIEELTKSTITFVGPEGVKRKIGRNEPCPCGSGRKYKKCCGK